MKNYKNLLPSLMLIWICLSCQKNIEPYNILMIVVDDMNNWVGVMENKAKTPNINALAESGILFDNAYCVVPACNPSRTAFMSGQRPETTGQFTNRGNFRDKPGGKEIVTIAQYLHQFGYETVAAGKIFHHPRGTGEEPAPLSDPVSWNMQRKGTVGTPGLELFLNDKGYATWIESNSQQIISPDEFISKYGVWGAIPNDKEECGDWQSAHFCAEYLLKEHKKPFFLACGIFRPHLPQIVPEEYFDLYPLESIELPEVPEDDMDDIPSIAQVNQSTPFFKLIKENEQWEKAVQGYLASMSFADDCVGHVMETLEESQYGHNTIVIFWTDHGWQLGHKNRWTKFTLWHQSTNSPLIIRYPEMKNAGTVCSEAVSFLDIYPTIVDLLGLPKQEKLEGESLIPWLEDPLLEKETPAIITYPEGNHSVVWKNWNYIHYQDGSEELYDHNVDPREYNNLAGNHLYVDLIKKMNGMIPVSKENLQN